MDSPEFKKVIEEIEGLKAIGREKPERTDAETSTCECFLSNFEGMVY